MTLIFSVQLSVGDPVAPGIIRSDFGWSIYTLSIFADQPVSNYLAALSSGIRLPDFAVKALA